MAEKIKDTFSINSINCYEIPRNLSDDHVSLQYRIIPNNHFRPYGVIIALVCRARIALRPQLLQL